MTIIEIQSLDDERVAAFSRLTEAQLRNRLEPELGIFIAESPKVIQRALDAGMQAESFLMERDKLDVAAPLVAQAQAKRPEPVPVFTGPTEVLAQLTGFELTRGVLCAMRRPALPSVSDLLATCADGRPARCIAVLEGIVDHTNVGAIFRSAAALGVDAVLVTSTCCDPLYRRSVRVSMGTVFQVPWTRIGLRTDDWPGAGIAQLHELGFATVALALDDDALPIDAPQLVETQKIALVLGTEGDGLAPETAAACDYVAKIPMRPGVDSLNVAAASAVAFWQFCRR